MENKTLNFFGIGFRNLVTGNDYIVDVKKCVNFTPWVWPFEDVKEWLADCDMSQTTMCSIEFAGDGEGFYLMGWSEGGFSPDWGGEGRSKGRCPYTPMELLEAVYGTGLLTDDDRGREFMEAVEDMKSLDEIKNYIKELVEDYKASKKEIA